MALAQELKQQLRQRFRQHCREHSIELALLTALPDGFLDCDARQLHEIIPGPTLIHLPGERDESAFVSILLHGNETSGLTALQQVLKSVVGAASKPLRSLILFVGNVESARWQLRRLPAQPDFNRIWAGGLLPEQKMAEAVIHYVAQSKPAVAIDIHNNTGRNPLYACINHVDNRFVQLARRFSETLVFFSEPHEVIANNMARYCVAVTLECGRAGESAGIDKASQLVEFALYADPLFPADHDFEDVDVFHTVAKMTLDEHCSIAFGGSALPADVHFPADFDRLNFTQLEAGFKLGEYRTEREKLLIRNDAGHDISADYLSYVDGNILVKKMFLPSMLTLDMRIIRQDCLGYVMEHYPLNFSATMR